MGEPAPGAILTDPELGTVFLMTEDLQFAVPPARVILGANLASAPLTEVIEPKLNLNEGSAGWGGESNLLDCGLLDEVTSVLAATPQTVHCKLLGE